MSQEKEILITYLLPYLNLKKRFPLLKAFQELETEASAIGLSKDELESARLDLQQLAEKAAEEILLEGDLKPWFKKFPIKKGDVVLGVGSDNVENLQGWFEILRFVSKKLLKKDPDFYNYGFEGETSVELIRRLPRLLEDLKPDWLFVDLGINDCLKMPVESGKTLVSLADSYENISAIEALAEEFVRNPVVWITPTGIISKLAEKAQFLPGSYDVLAINSLREIVAGKPGFVADPKGDRLGAAPAKAWFFAENGVHHSLAGHMETVKYILKSLAESKPKKGKQLGSES
jgi:lysophospholipase L1-like esterase